MLTLIYHLEQKHYPLILPYWIHTHKSDEWLNIRKNSRSITQQSTSLLVVSQYCYVALALNRHSILSNRNTSKLVQYVMFSFSVFMGRFARVLADASFVILVVGRLVCR